MIELKDIPTWDSIEDKGNGLDPLRRFIYDYDDQNSEFREKLVHMLNYVDISTHKPTRGYSND